MSLFRKARSKKGLSMIRIISAALVLSVLVLVVTESAKYLYTARVPKSVSSKIDPSISKLATVLGTARSSLDNLDNVGNVSVSDDKESDKNDKNGKADEMVLRVAILSDSHDDLEYLRKALDKIKTCNVSQVVFLGDYTDYGDTASLKKSKEIMDGAKIPYVSLPGDHDIAQTRDESNFISVFGPAGGGTDKPYDTFELEDVRFMYFDNSKNYTKIGDSGIKWFKEEIKNTGFLFLSQPLMTGNMLRVMGIIDGVKDEAVFAQNVQLLEEARSSNVKAIIAGDLHQFSKFEDPKKQGLWHYSVGAVLKSQSLEKLNFQPPRFAVLTIYKGGSYKIDDVTID